MERLFIAVVLTGVAIVGALMVWMVLDWLARH